MPDDPFWESTYANLSAETFGAPSDEIVALADTLPSGARVLDVGCGEGRNALYLATRGFDVTGIDISERGIHKLLNLARSRGLHLQAEVQDMVSYEFNAMFDLIIAHGCLHLIAREHWASLIARMKSHTFPGGYNVIATFTDALPIPDDLAPFTIGLFGEGELFDLYTDWEIMVRKSYILEDEHPGGIRHRHAINKIVAQKLASSNIAPVASN